MFHDDLLNLLKARQPGIWVRTSEEKEAVLAIKNAIDATETYENIYTWSMNEGIKQIVSDGGTMRYEIIDKQPSLMKLNELIQGALNESIKIGLNDVNLNDLKQDALKELGDTLDNDKKQLKLNIAFSVLKDTSLLSKFSIIIVVSGNFLIISNNDLPYIIIHPSSSIALISFLSIKYWIVMSLSVAVRYRPSFFKSNFIPFKTGIIFRDDNALLTKFNPSNKIFLLINIFIIIYLLIIYNYY